MGFGQPDMQWKGAGLCPETKQETQTRSPDLVEEVPLSMRMPDRSQKYKVPVSSYNRKMPISITSPPMTATAR